MALARLKLSLGRIFYQRCFYLFVSLIGLIVIGPLVSETSKGRLLLSAGHVLVLVSAVAAVGRRTTPFVIALLLGLPALAFHVRTAIVAEGQVHGFLAFAAFFIAFYIAAIVYLLRYAFSPEVMTDDKLFAGASVYLLLGVGWAMAYAVIQRLEPATFGVLADGAPHSFHDLLFMSFGYLTSNGSGDIVIAGTKAKTLAILEQVTGTLYVAILIARLAGIYPQTKTE